MVRSRRTINAKKSKAQATLDRAHIWTVLITAQIPSFATKANGVPLGSKAQLKWSQSEPRRLQAEGLIKPSRFGEPTHHTNIKNTHVMQKTWKEPKIPVRKHISTNSKNPRSEPIQISAPNAAMELRNYCVKHGLFAKWEGNGQSSSEIVNWWRETFHGQVSIISLTNNFIFIECIKESLKSRLLEGEQVFYKGMNFKFLDWKPKFNPNRHEFSTESRWIIIHSLPMELMHVKILIDIGNSIGKFVALEKNWSDKSDIKILIDVERSTDYLRNISINTMDGNYNLISKWFNGEIAEEICGLNPNVRKTQNRNTGNLMKPTNKVNIQFNNDIGGFIITDSQIGDK